MEALLNFVGCAMVVSRDQYILCCIARHISVFECDSN